MRRLRLAIAGLLLGTGLLPGAAPCQTVTLAQGGRDLTIAIGDQARLPGDFPADVYVPAAARLQQVDHARGGPLLLHFALDAGPEAVAADYATRMAAAGWRRARVVEVPGVLAQAWEHDTRVVILAARATEGGGTRLQLELRTHGGTAP